MAIALWLMYFCMKYGVYFSFEHPKPSRAWFLPFIQTLKTMQGILTLELDQCAWGKRPGDWDPVREGDVRTKKATTILTNAFYFKRIEKKCADVTAHEHRAIEGTSGTGVPRSVEGSEYPRAFCIEYALGVRAAWLQGVSPAPLSLAEATIPSFQENVARAFPGLLSGASPQTPVRSTARVVKNEEDFSSDPTAASSSSSPAAAAPPSVDGVSVPNDDLEVEVGVEERKEDYWIETPYEHIRVHVKPRRDFFDPTSLKDGPIPES